MIGVIADPAEHDVVREFFELFKTPWEFYRSGKAYDVVLCNSADINGDDAKLFVVYGGSQNQFDDQHGIKVRAERPEPCVLQYAGRRIPLYCESISFAGPAGLELVEEHSGESLLCVKRLGNSLLCRVGYDLLGEIRFLLTSGQPIENAAMPALELHIAFLRELIVRAGIAIAEIPPVPDGYRCIVCLTHDVDHPSIRRHGWDRTTVGFLYRALVGSVRNLLRGHIGLNEVMKNWMSCAKLPLVQLGLAKDFWLDFADRYLRLEKGLPSTFFVIPFSGRPGRRADPRAAKLRGSRYAAADIAVYLERLLTAGCEVGLHGIDAWADGAAAHTELDEIRRLTGMSEVGVRMHWLYFDRQSAATLEESGATYDSTVGYNESVGYRAGTTQAYKPLGCNRFLELPMHVMDTALFYPTYMDLSPDDAGAVLEQMIRDALNYGGCLTVNWHDRSTAPERLWGSAYAELLDKLRARGAWFATASQAVAWFQKRRAYQFQDGSDSTLTAESSSIAAQRSIPALRMARYNKPCTLQPTDLSRSTSDIARCVFN